jgi:hypothetical protein
LGTIPGSVNKQLEREHGPLQVAFAEEWDADKARGRDGRKENAKVRPISVRPPAQRIIHAHRSSETGGGLLGELDLLNDTVEKLYLAFSKSA